MPITNLGNVVALIKSETAPTKTYVIWAHIIDPLFPNNVILKRHNGTSWVKLVEDDYYLTIKATSDGQKIFSDSSFSGGNFKYIYVVNSRYIFPDNFSLSGDTITLTNDESDGVYNEEVLMFHFKK